MSDSLYDLLGLTDKASPAAIQEAYSGRRAALDALPDSEDKHNRIAILTDARDVLLDRRQRAGYDRRQRDRRSGDRRQPDKQPLSRVLPALAIVLLATAAWLVWRQTAPAPTSPRAPAVSPAPTPPTGSGGRTEAENVAAAAATVLPAPGPVASVANLPASAVDAAAAFPLAESPHAATVRAIADSTFAILGGGGQGTGVAIDHDKLLTNCHVIAPNVHKGPLLAINSVTGARTTITHAAFLVREDACVAHAPGLNARPMVMGDAARLGQGATIHSLGFAQGQLTFSTGHLLGIINRSGQNYLVSTNYCDHGVSGGPLVDGEGRLVGLTSGGTSDRKVCASLTAETARRVLDQTLIAIDAFPTDYMTNLRRRW